jgi:rhodanese-like protein
VKRPWTRFLGLAAAALLIAQGTAAREEKKDESEPFKRLTVAEVGKRLGEPNLLVVDGNSDEVYRDGHLPGAIHLLSKDMKEDSLPARKDSPIIFYCHNER